MALRDQPYIPLYVQDFLTDEKLIECSAQTTGVYIRLMCIMHKSEPYGTILLKQKDKQNGKQTKNFALKLAKQLPYDVEIIESSLDELLTEGVLILEDDKIYQKRMIKDNYISEERSKAGSKGGKVAQANLQANLQAKPQANSENEIEIENEIVIRDETFVFINLEDLKIEMLKSEQWIEISAMTLSTDIETVKSLIPKFCLEQTAKGNLGSIFREYKSHFINWARIQLEKGNKSKPKNILTYNELTDLASKGQAKFSDYELQPDKTWKHK